MSILPEASVRRLIRLTASWFSFLLLTASLWAQNTIRVPEDQPSIQAAINTANNGDTVLVAPGTYFENLFFSGRAITVKSSAGADSTIIDGGGELPVASFQSGEGQGTVLNGFTIRNGGPDGAIIMFFSSHQQCRVRYPSVFLAFGGGGEQHHFKQSHGLCIFGWRRGYCDRRRRVSADNRKHN
jgi:hypothetical protein